MANRSTMRDQARIELAVGSADSIQYTDDELNRAVDEVTADITRLMPLEKISELTIDYVVTDESFTSDADPGVFVSLASKPIQWATEVVTSDPAGTTFDRDTDYTIDYSNGKITHISGSDGGSMTGNTGFLISYNKSRIAVDISSITDLLAVIDVEYPIGDVPQGSNSFETWEDILWIVTTGRSGSQIETSDKEHIRISYHAQHTSPTDSTDGTFPRFIDEIVVKGIVAYALLIKYRETVLLSIHHNKLAGDVMALIDSEPIGAALDLIPYSSIDVSISTELTAITTALDKVQTLIGNAATGKAFDALVLAAIESALGNTALDAVAAPLTGSTESATEALDAVGPGETPDFHQLSDTSLDLIPVYNLQVHDTAGDTGDIKDAEDVWTVDDPGEEDFLVQDVGSSAHIAIGAEEYIQQGDPLVNKINLGDRAATLNSLYAETEIRIAQMYADRRKDFLATADRHLNQASIAAVDARGRMDQVDRKINEAQGRINLAQAFVSEGQQRANLSQAIVNAAQGWINAAQGYINEAQVRVANVQVILDSNNIFIAKGRLYVEEARARLDAIIPNLREGEARINMSRRTAENADRIHADALERYRDYMRMLENRVHVARRRSISSRRQYAGQDEGQSINPSPRTLPTS